MIQSGPDRLVGKMDHEIARKPCIDAWKRIAQDVKFQELDARVIMAVLDDEIMNDVSADIFEMSRPLDMLHPVEVAARRIQHRTEGMAAGKIG